MSQEQKDEDGCLLWVVKWALAAWVVVSVARCMDVKI